MRGDLTGTTVRTLAEWNGKLYLALDYADIAAWRTWVPFPSNSRGSGGLRTWLTFSQNQLTEAIADVRLADVRARIGKNLSELDLTDLSGARLEDVGYQFRVADLGLKTTTTGGLALPATDFPAAVHPGGRRASGAGELNVNALDLAPLVVLADHLPFRAEARQ